MRARARGRNCLDEMAEAIQRTNNQEDKLLPGQQNNYCPALFEGIDGKISLNPPSHPTLLFSQAAAAINRWEELAGIK